MIAQRAAAGFVACLIACGGTVALVAAADTPAAVDDPRARAAELAAIAPQLEQIYRDIDLAVKTLDRERFDPRAIVERVGRDPAKLVDWTRENIALLPYRGALRGSAGTLMGRAGNSLDRSLLLAELLRSVGCEVRLANATLSKDAARQLLGQATAAAAAAAGPRATPDSAEATQARARVREQAERLAQLVGPAPDGSADADRLAEAMADHWWVQRRTGGTWVDVDLTGMKIAPPARTVPCAALGDALPLDAIDCHEVELRVVIEAFKGGQLQTATVLKQTFRPAEMLGRTLDFTNAPGEPVADENVADDPAARRRLKAQLSRLSVYVPMLRVDNRTISNASFTTAGDVNQTPTLDPSGKLASAAGRVMGGMLGGLDGGGGGATGPAGVLTAQWIEYEVRVPGRPPRTIRRDVFDVLGPAARAAGIRQPPALTDAQAFLRARLLTARNQVLLQPCDLPVEFVVYTSAAQDLKQKDAWLGFVRGDVDTPAERRTFLANVSVGDSVTPLCAVIRTGLAGSGTFIASPNILQHRVWIDEGAGGGGDELVVRSGTDLAVTDADVLGPGAFRARLEQGVADTLAEHLALGPTAAPAENAFTLFDALAARGVAPVVVRPADGAAALAALPMPADVRARAAADLAAGQTLVLAGEGKGRWAWWRIDPHSGHTVGTMDTGYNAAMTEEAKINKYITEHAARWGEKITAKSLEYASKAQMDKWAKGIPARISLLNSWQTALKALTAAALWGGQKGF